MFIKKSFHYVTFVHVFNSIRSLLAEKTFSPFLLARKKPEASSCVPSVVKEFEIGDNDSGPNLALKEVKSSTNSCNYVGNWDSQFPPLELVPQFVVEDAFIGFGGLFQDLVDLLLESFIFVSSWSREACFGGTKFKLALGL